VEKVREFEKLIEQTRASLPAVRTAKAAASARAPHASLADLIRSGSVAVQQRAVSRTRTAAQPSGNIVLTTADVLASRPPSGTADTTSDEAAPRVRSGDILVPVTGHEIVARVATPEQVGAELGPGLQLVRVNSEQFDSWFVAGVLSRTENVRVAGRASSAGSGLRRIDVKRVSIPVLPRDQQRRYGQAFRQLAEFQTRLRQAASVGESLAREINDGLVWGSLTATPDS
jgi:hypothetical protein